MLGPITGPPLGGFLTTFLSWHWVFWINVPISIVGLVLVTKFLPEGEPRSPRPIDFPGFALTSVAFSGLVFGMSVVSLPALPIWYGYITMAVGAVTGIIYLWHAGRARYPLLDPKMLRYPLFRAGILGASNFRVGIGAIPFLLPLMLQLGFGLSPFQSGMITFVSAIGALASKFLAQRVFQLFGFRNVLGVGALISSIFIAVNGLFTPQTPQLLIMGCLLLGGVLRSTAFTGINAMVFSDIEDADSSQATAINSVAQQMSLATGVAIGGAILDIAAATHGGTVELSDFHIAFCIVAIISACAAFTFFRLPRNAGAEVSGHRRHRPAMAKE
jgi:MFS family permease